jgi:hypothetical protein
MADHGDHLGKPQGAFLVHRTGSDAYHLPPRISADVLVIAHEEGGGFAWHHYLSRLNPRRRILTRCEVDWQYEDTY